MSTVPRNSNGWPVISPELMTYTEILAEAHKWKEGRRSHKTTVSNSEWKKYTNELVKRGFSTAIEIQEGILPDEVPGEEARVRHEAWTAGKSYSKVIK